MVKLADQIAGDRGKCGMGVVGHPGRRAVTMAAAARLNLLTVKEATNLLAMRVHIWAHGQIVDLVVVVVATTAAAEAPVPPITPTGAAAECVMGIPLVPAAEGPRMLSVRQAVLAIALLRQETARSL